MHWLTSVNALQWKCDRCRCATLFPFASIAASARRSSAQDSACVRQTSKISRWHNNQSNRHLLTPFSTTSSTKLDASCKNVLFEILDIRLTPDSSEIDERRDDPGMPNFDSVPVLDFRVELLSCDTVSLVGLSRPLDSLEWLNPFVVPLVSSLRVFDLDSRFLNVPKMVVFFRSRPRSSRLPLRAGSADSSFCCWIMLILTFKELFGLLFGLMGVEVVGWATGFSSDCDDALSYGYCLLPLATLMLWRCWLE